jgi:hypothetical protein
MEDVVLADRWQLAKVGDFFVVVDKVHSALKPIKTRPRRFLKMTKNSRSNQTEILDFRLQFPAHPVGHYIIQIVSKPLYVICT